jgi:hypothetical protein
MSSGTLVVPDAMAATPEVDEALKAKEAKEVLNLEGADNPQNWSHAKKVRVLQMTEKSRDLGVHSNFDRSPTTAYWV